MARMVIIDATSFIYRAFFAIRHLSAPDGRPTNAAFGFGKMLLRVLRERPTHGAAVFDAPGKSFRAEIYPEYKANRPPTPDELKSQVPLCMEMTRLMGIPTISIEGVESDDVIATLVTQARERGFEVLIVTSDKDLMALVGEGVTVWDTMKDVRYGPREVEEKYGVPPEAIPDLLALMGDTSDNVPGVPGIGQKTAAKLLQRFRNIDNLLKSLSLVKGRAAKSIREHRDQLLLSRRLVRLRTDVDLGGDIDEVTRLRDPQPDKLRQLFEELAFRQLLRDLEDLGWIGERATKETPPAVEVDDPAALLDLQGDLTVALYGTADDPHSSNLAGIAIRNGSGRTFYVPVAGDDSMFSQGAPLATAVTLLRRIFGDGRRVTVHHHKEALILLDRLGITPSASFDDPMIAAYLVDPSRMSYSIDALAQQELGTTQLVSCSAAQGKGKKRVSHPELPMERRLSCASSELGAIEEVSSRLMATIEADERLRSLYHDLELPLTRVLAAMERRGVMVDTAYLERLGAKLEERLREIEDEVANLAGERINLNSPKQLARFFFEKKGLPVIKKGKTGPSTDAEVLETLAAMGYREARLVHEHRTLSKLKSGYVDALPKLINPLTGRIHTSFNQAAAATGRLSSSNPNLQNIPVRTEIGRKIREAFVAPPGHQLLSLDYSQIELRVLAHLSGDEKLIEAFRSGEDIHTRTALELFGEVDDEKRRIAKAVNFGVIYGQTPYGLQKALGIGLDEARAYIEGYFERYPKVRQYMDRVIEEVRQRGYAETILGRRRPIHLTRKGSHEERMARNTPIQGSAADIMKLAMLRVDEFLRESMDFVRMILTVHDELIFEVPDGRAEEVAHALVPIMEGVMELKVPLRVDWGYGRSWADAH